jgi:hypothetical protein
MYRLKQKYNDFQTDIEVLNILLENKNRELMLSERDESYGNTPLHVACSLHSYEFT